MKTNPKDNHASQDAQSNGDPGTLSSEERTYFGEDLVRSLGHTARGHRIREAKVQLKLERLAWAAEQGRKITEAEAETWAEERFKEIRSQAPNFLKEFEGTAPTSTSPLRQEVVDHVEIAAVCRHPNVRWLTEQLLRQQMGAPAERTLPVAALYEMAFAMGVPDAKRVYNDLCAPDPRRAWAYRYPASKKGVRGLGATYNTLNRIVAEKDHEMTLHVNLEAIREIAELTDEDGEPKHPDIGRYLAVDGSLVEAHLPQRPVSKRQAESMAGDRYPNAAFQPYGGVFGYKLMAIVDIASSLPLVWDVLPASATEPEATRALLERLFELWPECPAECLVGDKAYDQRDLAEELEFRWGIHPVFPLTDQEPAKDIKYGKTDGVPTCEHGAWKLRKAEGFWNERERNKWGGKRGGAWAPSSLKGRIRFVCPEEICKGTVTTYARENARFYTFLPRRGKHKRVALRYALSVRRNQVESVFASLKHLGVGNTAQDRVKWGGEKAYYWTLSLGMMFITHRRLAHETGTYEKMEEEAKKLDLLRPVTRDKPRVGPSKKALVMAELKVPQPSHPSTWDPDWDETGYHLGDPPASKNGNTP